MHLFYTTTIVLYVKFIYIDQLGMESWTEEEEKTYYKQKKIFAILLMVGIFYPWIYDLVQLVRSGPMEYASDPWNYVDFIYIYGGIANAIL